MSRLVKNNRRNQQLNLSLTEAEINVLRLRAAAAEMRLVDYSRFMLLRKRAIPPRPTHLQLDQLAYEQLKRLGNNLNQIARVVNATRQPPSPALEALLHDIRAVLNRNSLL
jgi:hypothetical protein